MKTRNRKIWRTMSGVSKVGFVFAILAAVAGCDSVVSTWVNPCTNPNATGHWAGTAKRLIGLTILVIRAVPDWLIFCRWAKFISPPRALTIDNLATTYKLAYSSNKNGDGDAIYLTNTDLLFQITNSSSRRASFKAQLFIC